ncbi:hypothetical protein F2Q70_00003489 [Brassica cretica]|uniref:Uncharacterized protein n=2 Tax=Brassica cretica TaxID=69181 RepID=A0A8S9IN41_BRACR|nr:hypothetical protein F2Q68_00020973 [Brassica cretica]KAF2571298.1 hypothetical protein F2Q70_00003489 [Brassica cretica]KAF3565850.1 hypothetical protein DY000_02015396 [Brassica cretica]
MEWIAFNQVRSKTGTRRRVTYPLEALDETNPPAQTVRRSDLRRALTRRNNTRRRLASAQLASSSDQIPDQTQPSARRNKLAIDLISRPRLHASVSASTRDPDCKRPSQPHLATPTESVRLHSRPDRKKTARVRVAARVRGSSIDLWRSGFYNLENKGNPNSENMNRTWLFCKD